MNCPHCGEEISSYLIYQKEYYEKNKDEIRRQRKQKYAIETRILDAYFKAGYDHLDNISPDPKMENNIERILKSRRNNGK